MENKIKSLLSKYRVRYRYITFDDDRVIIGIESTKSNNLLLYNKLKILKLVPVNITYGKWVFKIKD